MDARNESTSSSTPMFSADAQGALAIDPKSSRLPVSVMLVWLCAFAGLAVYTASWYVPSLAQLGR